MSTAADLSAADRAHLERARVLAHRGWGHVHPNPLVGCVVGRGAEVVGEGWHAIFGGPHAEVVALDAAGERGRGATAYVSLEPCAHHGKTPPCTDALVRAGVVRVVYGAADPGVESGGGARTLAAAGVETVGPVWSDAVARAENAAFHHTARHGTPHVALKLAVSLDGKVAAASGERTRLTGPEADREVHRLRTGFDAVMVGIGTAEVDDPRLTVRLSPTGRKSPHRIVLDARARLSPRAALFEDVDDAPVHVFTRCEAPTEPISALERAGARVHRVAETSEGVSLEGVLARCRELDIRSILCEGGARLAAALLAGAHAQRLYLFVAPRALGEGGVPAFGTDAHGLPWDAFAPSLPPQVHGRDVLLVYDRRDA